MENYLKAILGFSAAIGIIGLFTWAIGWQDIIYGLQNAKLRYLFPAAGIAFVGLLLVGVAWWIAVRDVANLGFLDGMRVFLVTFFANSITPLGQFGGEPFIAYILSRDADLPMEESLGAVIVADVINAIPFFTISILGIFTFLIFFPLNSLIATLLKIVVGLSLAAAILFALVWTNEKHALKVLGTVSHGLRIGIERLGLDSWSVLSNIRREYVVEKGESFFEILRSLAADKRMLVKSLSVAHLSSLAGSFALYLFLLSLGIDAPLSALLFIIPASMLAGYLPLPGGLGGIEAAMTALLVAVTQVPAAEAAAAVLLFRVCTYWLGLTIGGYFASHMSVDILAEQYDT